MRGTLVPLGAPATLSSATFARVDARRITLSGPETYHLPKWRDDGDPKRLAALRRIVMTEGRDPRVAEVAVRILRAANVPSRAYEQQAAAILAWVQHSIYYVNEPGERLQAPLYTLQHGYGDCDCLALLLASLYEAVSLPWRFVLSGYPKRPVPGAARLPTRWVEGTPKPRGLRWTHIYLAVGSPPFRPTRWLFAEPSARVPLGWDVVAAARASGRAPMPELDASTTALAPPTAGLGSLVGTWESVKDRLDLDDIVAGVREHLRWKRLAVTVVSGAVAGLLTQAAILLVTRWWKRHRRP